MNEQLFKQIAKMFFPFDSKEGENQAARLGMEKGLSLMYSALGWRDVKEKPPESAVYWLYDPELGYANAVCYNAEMDDWAYKPISEGYYWKIFATPRPTSPAELEKLLMDVINRKG